jgi:AcrR family transcriptional regulator
VQVQITSAKTETSNTREQILAAAEVLFANKGFKATTLKDVSASSGVNSALVSYYFGNKDGLRHQIFLRQSARTQALVDQVEIAGEKPTLKTLKSLLTSVFTQIRKDATYYRLGLWALADGGEITAQVAEDVWNPVYFRFRELLRALNDEMRAEDLEARTTLLCGAIHQYSNLRWNFLEKIAFTADGDKILKSYEDLVIEQLTKLLAK